MRVRTENAVNRRVSRLNESDMFMKRMEPVLVSAVATRQCAKVRL